MVKKQGSGWPATPTDQTGVITVTLRFVEVAMTSGVKVKTSPPFPTFCEESMFDLTY